MKLLILAVSLYAVPSANASEFSPSTAKSVAKNTYEEHHVNLLGPDTEWRSRAKDYAKLLEDCGQTTNYGLATDESSESPIEIIRYSANTR